MYDIKYIGSKISSVLILNLQEAEAYSEYEEGEYPFDEIEEEAESNVPSSQSDSEMA